MHRTGNAGGYDVLSMIAFGEHDRWLDFVKKYAEPRKRKVKSHPTTEAQRRNMSRPIGKAKL